jgi:hypothetical protein
MNIDALITDVLERLAALDRTAAAPTRQRLNKQQTAKREGVGPRTIDRRTADPDSGFPKPEVVAGRCYWWSDQLDQYDELCRRKGAALADVKEGRRERIAKARKAKAERKQAGASR